MVKIRLMRVGKRNQPSYRVVVADSRSPRDGRIIESIGHYNPRQEPSVVQIDSDRAVHWLERGAQPSNTVRKLLQITGAWYSFTGEKPPAGSPAAVAAPARPTAAASVKATPAASVAEENEAPAQEATVAEETPAEQASDEAPSEDASA